MAKRRAFRVRVEHSDRDDVVSSQYSLRECRSLAKEWRRHVGVGRTFMTTITIEVRQPGSAEFEPLEIVWQREVTVELPSEASHA